MWPQENTRVNSHHGQPINNEAQCDQCSKQPLIFMNEEYNKLREDVAQVTVTQDEALKNAPKKDSDYFRIPKVLDK